MATLRRAPKDTPFSIIEREKATSRALRETVGRLAGELKELQEKHRTILADRRYLRRQLEHLLGAAIGLKQAHEGQTGDPQFATVGAFIRLGQEAEAADTTLATSHSADGRDNPGTNAMEPPKP